MIEKLLGSFFDEKTGEFIPCILHLNEPIFLKELKDYFDQFPLLIELEKFVEKLTYSNNCLMYAFDENADIKIMVVYNKDLNIANKIIEFLKKNNVKSDFYSKYILSFKEKDLINAFGDTKKTSVKKIILDSLSRELKIKEDDSKTAEELKTLNLEIYKKRADMSIFFRKAIDHKKLKEFTKKNFEEYIKTIAEDDKLFNYVMNYEILNPKDKSPIEIELYKKEQLNFLKELLKKIEIKFNLSGLKLDFLDDEVETLVSAGIAEIEDKKILINKDVNFSLPYLLSVIAHEVSHLVDFYSEKSFLNEDQKLISSLTIIDDFPNELSYLSHFTEQVSNAVGKEFKVFQESELKKIIKAERIKIRLKRNFEKNLSNKKSNY